MRKCSTRAAADGGWSLPELLVAMAVMTIFAGIFVGVLFSLLGTTQKVQATGDLQAQMDAAFLRLDKQIRYAAAINTPGQNGSDWYVEFQTTNTGAKNCTQLRVSSQTLQERSWTVTGSPVTPPPWAPLATGIVNNPSTQVPFTFLPAGATFTTQRLTVSLFGQAGPAQHRARSSSTVTFTALNSSASTVTNTGGQLVCTEVPRS